MIVSGIQCPKCKDIIYSRAGHDFKYCTCGEVFVDGGQGVSGGRVGYTKEFPPAVEIEVFGVESKQDLVVDWNHSKNALGQLKGGTVDLRHKIISIGGVRLSGSDAIGTESNLRRKQSKTRVQKPKTKRNATSSKTRKVENTKG